VDTTYAYDPNRRWLKEIDTTTEAGKALQRSEYIFDLVGNVSSVTNGGYKPVSQSYSYDELYQLVGAKGSYTGRGGNGRTDSYQQNFAYDDIGNITEKSSTHQWTPSSESPEALQYARAYSYDTQRPHTLRQVGGWSYQYDLNGNLLWRALMDEKAEVYDGPGQGHDQGGWLKHDPTSSSPGSSIEKPKDTGENRGRGKAYAWGLKHFWEPPSGHKLQQYSWDSENRLTEAQQDGKSVRFLYDREGNRTAKRGVRGESKRPTNPTRALSGFGGPKRGQE
jgi:hypothetical protein